MKTKKPVYSKSIRVLIISISTIVLFIALYFADRPLRFETIRVNLDNPMIYVCLLISFLTSFFLERSVVKGAGSKEQK